MYKLYLLLNWKANMNNAYESLDRKNKLNKFVRSEKLNQTRFIQKKCLLFVIIFIVKLKITILFGTWDLLIRNLENKRGELLPRYCTSDFTETFLLINPMWSQPRKYYRFFIRNISIAIIFARPYHIYWISKIWVLK